MLLNSIISLIVISQIPFIISSSLCLIIHMRQRIFLTGDKNCFLLFLKFLHWIMWKDAAVLGLWSLRIATSTRTRENGSIQTPVDGWKFRVERKSGICVCYLPRRLLRERLPSLAWFIDRSTTLEATNRESSRHVVRYTGEFITKWNGHVAQISRDTRILPVCPRYNSRS